MPDAPTLLIAEDDADLRSLLADTFRRLGYDVIPAADGAEALRAAAGHDIDFAVIDMMLPGASGFRVLEAVKATGGARAVMISGSGAAPHQAYAAALGADGFLVKPFAVADLIHLLAGPSADDRPFEHDSSEHSALPS